MRDIGASALAVLTASVTVAAHGHVKNVIVNGLNYRNYDPTADIYNPSAPITPGWYAGDSDNGFVAPDSYSSPDIICHRAATPAKAHIQLNAGDIVYLQWDTWPDSHHGPVMDYLANCNGPCETVDKTTLRFFKIDGAGMVSPGSPGRFASDNLIANNNTWAVRIPANIATGNYVLRHEIIALHSANDANGAQNYPQCVNLAIVGSDAAPPSGTPATSLYKTNDPGILVNIYTSTLSYIVPGPTIIAGGVSSISQSYPVIRGTGTPTSLVGTGSVSRTSSAPPTVSPTTGRTKASPPATSNLSSNGAQTVYGQCGGMGWTGPTICVAKATCASFNAYYSQCTPAP